MDALLLNYEIKPSWGFKGNAAIYPYAKVVSNYLLAIAVISRANLLPAFAPWRIECNSRTRNPRQCFPRHPRVAAEGVRGKHGENPKRAFGLLTLFFLSPISSAQLFEAVGIIKQIALGPLLLAFVGGRLISYSIYVSGASVLKETSLGQIIKDELTFPLAITIQKTLAR
jgi:hypothetical protein